MNCYYINYDAFGLYIGFWCLWKFFFFVLDLRSSYPYEYSEFLVYIDAINQ